MRGVRPPRAAIQRRTCDGYIEYSIWVASGLVTARPLAPKSQAAWKPRSACEALIFVDVSSDPPAAIVGNPDHGLRSPNARKQENRREQPRYQPH